MKQLPIEPHELQPGLLLMDQGGTIWNVGGFDQNFAVAGLHDAMRICPFEQLQGIPLTADWLDRLGLTLQAASRTEYLVPHTFSSLRLRLIGGSWYLLYGNLITQAVTSVHHVQQLVWALGRVWLTIHDAEPIILICHD